MEGKFEYWENANTEKSGISQTKNSGPMGNSDENDVHGTPPPIFGQN
jgi:hypothetical protein